ncbi:MAG: hypothetical protein CMI13_00290 [Oleibacter sp.]|nr:hypothetical protein [Thalassolituus sp.]
MQPTSASPGMPLLVLRDPAGQADSLPEYHGYLLQEFSEPEELIQAGLTLAEGIIVIFTGDDVLVQQLRSALPDLALVAVAPAVQHMPLLAAGALEVCADLHHDPGLLHRAMVRLQAERIRRLGSHRDELTGLASRHLMHDRVQHALKQSRRRNTGVALFSLGISRFRMINELHGLQAGDDLLIACARRLQSLLRCSDSIARMGGDQFAVLLEPVTDTASALAVADKINAELSRPFIIRGREVFISVRIGIETAERSGHDADNMVRHAELAMHQVNSDDSSSYRLYQDSQGPEDRVRAALESGLHNALEQNELRLVYQPQVSVDGGEFTGVEVLLRWAHPLLGDVSPAVFIPVMEETGLIARFGEWALRQSCQQFAFWLQQGTVPQSAKLSVNLSPKQFSQPDLSQRICSALTDAGLSPQHLTLEITESTLMRNIAAGVSVLNELRNLGVSTAIDDFGTGYSSLAYLKDLPIDYLKIDRMFVKDIVSSSHDAAIASSIIALAHNLGLKVIAEGVEDEEVLDVLEVFGCDQYQGFYYARPVEASELPTLVRRCA